MTRGLARHKPRLGERSSLLSPSVICFANATSLITPARRRAYKAQPPQAALGAAEREADRPIYQLRLRALPSRRPSWTLSVTTDSPATNTCFRPGQRVFQSL